MIDNLFSKVGRPPERRRRTTRPLPGRGLQEEVSAGLPYIRPCFLTPTSSHSSSRELSSSPPLQSELQTLSIRSADLLTLSLFRRLCSPPPADSQGISRLLKKTLSTSSNLGLFSSVVYFVLRKNLSLIFPVSWFISLCCCFFFKMANY